MMALPNHLTTQRMYFLEDLAYPPITRMQTRTGFCLSQSDASSRYTDGLCFQLRKSGKLIDIYVYIYFWD